jgi:hypothetical protein
MKTAAQPSRDFLGAHGLAIEPEELQAMVRYAIVQLQESLYPPDPSADLTAAEVEALDRGGLDLSPKKDGEESPLARTTARYAALLGTSLTTADAAARLRVEPSRVRQRLAEGTLYGIRSPQGWRLPAFQFQEDGPLPSVGEVIALLSSHLHPLAVHNFFTLPSADLHAPELDRDLSPREWLQAGYPPQAVAELAAHVE